MQTLNQIALSVQDLRRTHQWYVDVFGFAMAGGTEASGLPKALASVQGWVAERL